MKKRESSLIIKLFQFFIFLDMEEEVASKEQINQNRNSNISSTNKSNLTFPDQSSETTLNRKKRRNLAKKERLKQKRKEAYEEIKKTIDNQNILSLV